MFNPITREPVSVKYEEIHTLPRGGRKITVSGVRYLLPSAVANFTPFELWELELVTHTEGEWVFVYLY